MLQGGNIEGGIEAKGKSHSGPCVGSPRNGSALRSYVVQLLAGLFETCFTSQSAAQTVFSFQAKRIVTDFHSYNVYLSSCLIFEPVSYLHHSTVTFLDLLSDYKGLTPKISLLNPEPVLLFFRGR
jgi:hypothetical protein